MEQSLIDHAAMAVSSEFFMGGVALGLIGTAAALLRLVWRALSQLVARRVWVSVTLDNRSSSFRHLCIWIEESDALAKVRRLRAVGRGRSSERLLLVPAPGRHWFVHAGQIGVLSRSFDEKARGGRDGQGPLESLTISLPFGRVATIRAWIEEGRCAAQRRVRRGPAVHMLRGEYWDELGTLTRRSIATVLADDDRIERLFEDVRRFYDGQGWYADRGVPWRRGYLLHGPPGTGKSSAIRAIASELDRDIATVDLARPGLGDEELREAMATAPRGAVLAIEDVDALHVGRDGEKRTGVTFSGLLNAIDGVAAQEGRALMLTTNHPERLDPALVRPGRVDLAVELGPVGAETAARLFERFFPGETAQAAAFARALGAARIAPATLQGWLLTHRDDAAMAATAAGLIDAKRLAAE